MASCTPLTRPLKALPCDQFYPRGPILVRVGDDQVEDLVLYCARHDFGTYALQKTGNIAAVMNSMGHSDVKTAMTYQHPELNVVRDAINSRHILRHTTETGN
jgi:integrase